MHRNDYVAYSTIHEDHSATVACTECDFQAQNNDKREVHRTAIRHVKETRQKLLVSFHTNVTFIPNDFKSAIERYGGTLDTEKETDDT